MLIRLDKVAKIYRMGEVEIQALRDMSFEIAKGEFVAIIGPSGSGKTTLLDILGCLSRPTDGEYFLDGVNVKELSDRGLASLRNKKIGFVFQTFHLLSRTTALQNVELPLFYAGVRKKERVERAKEALRIVGLEDRISHRPNQLSGGQQQRVAIARALANNPSMILADEPTGNLDSRSGREIVGVFASLHTKGHTILLVTHDPELARYAQRKITLRDGTVVSDVKGEDLVPVEGK